MVPSRVRRIVKEDVKQRVKIEFAALSRQNVSVVVASVKMDNQLYRAVGTAKRHPLDPLDVKRGLDLAYERAIVELVDKIVDPSRRVWSIVFEPESMGDYVESK